MSPADAHATPRDRHLFDEGPKRVLTLDGGGVRGAIAIAFLERIEAVLAEQAGRRVPLCEHFDLIGGSSTGALIASAMAIGMPATELRDRYFALAPKIFRRTLWRVQGLQAKFDAHALTIGIREVMGERTFDTPDLLTGLALVTKRMDTGSTWVLSNNPRAPYWETPADGSFIGNRHFSLTNLIRASAAAPHYFDPELLPIATGEPDGLFIDGGVSPHNNPALAMFLMVRAAAYGLRWATGPRRLMFVSVGTGAYRAKMSTAQANRARAIGLALTALSGLITDGERMVLTMMQWMGECPQPWPVNSEVGTLADEFPGSEKLFRFLRYDVEVEQRWLAEQLDITVSDRDIALLKEMDNPAGLARAHAIGERAAERQIQAEHLDFAAA